MSKAAKPRRWNRDTPDELLVTEAQAQEEHRLLTSYKADLSHLPMLSDIETRKLLQQLKTLPKDSDAWVDVRNRVVEGHMRLVWWAAEKFGDPALDQLDSIQTASLGLMQAADGYNPERATRFTTYATRVIQNALWAEAASERGPVTVPPTTQKKLRAATKKLHEKQAQTGDVSGDVPLDMVAEEAGVHIETAVKARNAQHGVPIDSSAYGEDAYTGADGGIALADTIPSNNYPAPDAGLFPGVKAQQDQLVGDLMDVAYLSDQERAVIRLHYGLTNDRTHTLEEVADILRLSVGTAKRLSTSAMKKLRRTAINTKEH